MSDNWLSRISDQVLSGLSAPPTSREGADYKQSGSVCTSRGAPPDNQLPPRTNNGRTEYRPNPQALRNLGYTEEEIAERVGGRV